MCWKRYNVIGNFRSKILLVIFCSCLKWQIVKTVETIINLSLPLFHILIFVSVFFFKATIKPRKQDLTNGVMFHFQLSFLLLILTSRPRLLLSIVSVWRFLMLWYNKLLVVAAALIGPSRHTCMSCAEFQLPSPINYWLYYRWAECVLYDCYSGL